MSDPILLEAEERELLMDLLRLEHSELPVEIHHVQNQERRQALHHRQAVVQEILRKLGAEEIAVTP